MLSQLFCHRNTSKYRQWILIEHVQCLLLIWREIVRIIIYYLWSNSHRVYNKKLWGIILLQEHLTARWGAVHPTHSEQQEHTHCQVQYTSLRVYCRNTSLPGEVHLTARCSTPHSECTSTHHCQVLLHFLHQTFPAAPRDELSIISCSTEVWVGIVSCSTEGRVSYHFLQHREASRHQGVCFKFMVLLSRYVEIYQGRIMPVDVIDC